MFYLEKLPQKSELDYAASKFRAIEIDGKFCGILKARELLNLCEATPKDFVFFGKSAVVHHAYMQITRRANPARPTP